MTVTPIKNGGQAIIQYLDDCYYYIRQYMGDDFLEELKVCMQPIDIQEKLEATERELESYEESLESAQRALMDIKDIIKSISGLARVRQSQTALDAIQEIVDIINQEV